MSAELGNREPVIGIALVALGAIFLVAQLCDCATGCVGLNP